MAEGARSAYRDESRMNADEGTEPKKKHDGFFHIDRRVWAAVCDCQSMNLAVAYLVLATGTGAANNMSKWSAKAIESWTGMRRLQGSAAIKDLTARGFIGYAKGHTTALPRYLLRSWDEVDRAKRQAKGDGFQWTPADVEVAQAIELGGQPGNAKDRQRAEKLYLMGFLDRSKDLVYSIADSRREPTPADELIWLPNALVKGTTKGEPSPVTKLRLSGDTWALRLLVDLYHAHHLQSDGGVLRRFVHSDFERKRLGEQGLYTVWGFKNKNRAGLWEGPLAPHQRRPKVEGNEDSPIWASLAKLERMGLLAFVPHLFSNNDPAIEPLHSFGATWGGGEKEEEAMRCAAIEAGSAMLQPGQVDQAKYDGFHLIAPVPHYLEQVTMVGLLRLRYRPHTLATSRWYEELVSGSPAWVKRYKSLEEAGRYASPAVQEWEAWGT